MGGDTTRKKQRGRKASKNDKGPRRACALAAVAENTDQLCVHFVRPTATSVERRNTSPEHIDRAQEGTARIGSNKLV